MLENRIDATLSVADAIAILDAVALIQSKLPFLEDLPPEERESLPKLTLGSRAFAQKALEIAEQNPGLMPRSFDIMTMRRDWELFQTLAPLAGAVARLNKLLDDTLTLTGSEVMVSALLIYRLVRATDGCDGEEAELAQRFVRKSLPTAASPDAA